jgi:formylglycine-generating enzyme required for sulfatase activity
MGSSFPDPKRSESEVPQHTVTFGKPFALGRFEVTNEQWNVCVEDGGCQYWAKGEGRVPKRVLWRQAQTFVSWLSKKTGKRYRLPSEAEWEYAARGGTSTRYPWGDSWDAKRANVGTNVSIPHEINVGSFGANAFGLFDMIGNLEEWVQDCWHDGYYNAPSNGDAWESGDCDLRVLRGGGYLSIPDKARVTSRNSIPLDFSGGQEGFRVARTM